MPKVEVVFHQESPGKVFVLKWLEGISKSQSTVLEKLRARIEQLERQGHELSGHSTKLLRGGIYELRVNHQSGAYRLLYFFYQGKVVLCHGVQKKDAHENSFHGEIETAIDKKRKHSQNPDNYTYYEELEYPNPNDS